MKLKSLPLFALASSFAVTAVACDAGESSEEPMSTSATPTSAGSAEGTDGSESDGEDDSTGGVDTSVDPTPGTDPDTGDNPNPTATGGPDDPMPTDSGSDMPIDPQNVIDDFEDGDPLILAANGRKGAWYTYNDETKGATQVPGSDEAFAPVEGGPDGSLFMGHTDGTGFAVWGAGLGLDLNNEGDDEGGPGIRNPYDASGFQGIVFSARGSGPVRVKFLVEAVVPMDTGGTCDSPTDCEDAHGKIVPLTADWAQYQIGFNELFQ